MLRTIESIRQQTFLNDGSNAITYVVQATEGVDLSSIEVGSPANLEIDLRTASDSGLYQALRWGFAGAGEANAYCYLGAGDYLSPHALEIVSQVMADGAEWLTGLIVGYNDRGHMIEARVPYRFRSELIRKGAYGRWLPYVQQESTFWNARLHGEINWDEVQELRLAGDAKLWNTFARISDLVVVEAWLGGFEQNEGQLSRRFAPQYAEEMRQLSESPSLLDRLLVAVDWTMWHAPRSIKRRFDPSRYVYDVTSRRYSRPVTSP